MNYIKKSTIVSLLVITLVVFFASTISFLDYRNSSTEPTNTIRAFADVQGGLGLGATGDANAGGCGSGGGEGGSCGW